MNQNNVCRPNDPDCAAAGIKHDLVAERTAVAIRNILSGDNACGTLVGKDGKVNAEHLERSIRPVIQVGEDEKNMIRAERARVSQESEDRRQCLDLIHANAVGLLPREIADRLRKVLGYAVN